MKFLSKGDCRKWSAALGLADPIRMRGKPAAQYKHQVIALDGKSSRKTSHAIRDILLSTGTNDEMMVEALDWPFYGPEEMEIVRSIRSRYGCNSDLITTPGHLMEGGEKLVGVGLFILFTLYEWSTAAYIPSTGVSVFSWESETLEVFS